MENENKFTDEEIIRALGCCINDDCDNCPNDFGNCYSNLAGYALDLINRQKEEIERLQEMLDATIAGQETLQKAIDNKKAEIEGLKKEIKEIIAFVKQFEGYAPYCAEELEKKYMGEI